MSSENALTDDLKTLFKNLVLNGTTDAMAEANRPIMRGYLCLAGIYYATMVPVHLLVLSGSNQINMVLASLMATFTMALGWKACRARLSATRMELIAGAANLSIYINVMLAVHTRHNRCDGRGQSPDHARLSLFGRYILRHHGTCAPSRAER